MEPVGRAITPDLAREIVSLRADQVSHDRMDELAEMDRQGTLSTEERAEYEKIVAAIHLIEVLQSRASMVLSLACET